MADDAVLLIDPGPVEPKGAARGSAEPGGAPGGITYVRRDGPRR